VKFRTPGGHKEEAGAFGAKRTFALSFPRSCGGKPDRFTGSFEALTPEQKQALEQRLKQMVSDGLTHCLRDLKLMP
jgi:hypothetical protein